MSEFPAKPTHLWAQIQRLGVNENVSSYLEYERLCVVGAREAKDFICADNPPPFSARTSRIVHRLMFRNVHPWAGVFRTAGESVIISGYPAADSWRIGRELDL